MLTSAQWTKGMNATPMGNALTLKALIPATVGTDFKGTAATARVCIDYFHERRRICYSFVFMLVRPTGLTLR